MMKLPGNFWTWREAALDESLSGHVPYSFILLAYCAYSLCCAAVASAMWLYTPARALLPFAGRIWLGSTVGFFLANFALVSFVLLALEGVGIAGGDAGSDWFGYLLGGVAVQGPFIASGAGVILGSLVGGRIEWRRRRTRWRMP